MGQVDGFRWSALAADLNAQGISTARWQGGCSAVQAQRVVRRIRVRLQETRLACEGRRGKWTPFRPINCQIALKLKTDIRASNDFHVSHSGEFHRNGQYSAFRFKSCFQSVSGKMLPR